MLSNLSEKDIRRFADSRIIFDRGMGYFKRGNVSTIELAKGGKMILAEVDGNYGLYDVEIWEEKGELEADCDCPYDGYICKHIVAVLLKFYKMSKHDENVDRESLKKKKKMPLAEKKGYEMNMQWDFKMEEIVKRTSSQAILNAFELLRTKKIDIVSMTNGKLVAKVDERNLLPKWHYNDCIYDDKIRVRIKKTFHMTEPLIECDCARYGSARCEHVAATMLAYYFRRYGKKLVDVEDEFISGLRRKKFRSLIEKLDTMNLESQIPKTQYEFFFTTKRLKNRYTTCKDDGGFYLQMAKSRVLKSGKQGVISQVREKHLEKNYNSMSDRRRTAFKVFIRNVKYSRRLGWYSASDNNLSKGVFEDDADGSLLLELQALYRNEPEAFRHCVFPGDKGTADLIVKTEKERNRAILTCMISAGDRRFHLGERNVTLIGNMPLWCSVYEKGSDSFVVLQIDTLHPEMIRKMSDFSGAELKLEELNDFLEQYYLKLSNILKVALPDEYEPEEINVKATPRLFLRDHLNSFNIELRFLYAREEVSEKDVEDIVSRDENGKMVRIKRDRESEKEYLRFLMDNGTMERDGFLVPAVDPYLWLSDAANELVAHGYEIFGKSDLLNNRLNPEKPSLRLEISSGIDWFDLKGELSFGENTVPLNDLMNTINKHERFIRLSDGTRGVIPAKWLEKLSGTIGFLKRDKKGNAKATASQIAIVESILDISKKYTMDEKYRQIKKKFSRFKSINSAPLPGNMKGTLRPYQKAGYDWLHFLKDFSFGGCLADEMGLGKTVQVLALLLSEKENGNETPSLVVVPRSLMFNWENEIKKFTPSISAYIHHGTGRSKTGGRIWGYNRDLIITTYATLRKDADIFGRKTFHYIVLDESQQIKNPLSKTARAIYGMNARYRLAMTGTPIENNSMDLWSQFAFLNPGLLGNIDYFKDTFVKSIERDGDAAKTSSLRNTIYPFLLMRKKDMVAKDLPEKQITVSYCGMSSKQRTVYESHRSRIRREIDTAIREEGIGKSRFKILQGLTKLRQICNHPRLIDESYMGGSGKLDMLKERMEEVISEGHKVLIFSSFVKMLHIVRAEFERKNIPFSYLDGRTRKRKEAVERFQNDPAVSAFLISLKAGGLGLNLTEADYVFIVDPWWNPAAEMQAIDRTHRIGQTKSVFVYKAITKDSVEEKILKLQESKVELVKNVIAVDKGIFKKLGRDDIEKLFA
jgi:non-specific serine/threonine protein kinase